MNQFKITLSEEATNLLFGEHAHRIANMKEYKNHCSKSKILEELIILNLKHYKEFDINNSFKDN